MWKLISRYFTYIFEKITFIFRNKYYKLLVENINRLNLISRNNNFLKTTKHTFYDIPYFK